MKLPNVWQFGDKTKEKRQEGVNVDAIGEMTMTTLMKYAQENHPTEVASLMADCWRQMVLGGHATLKITLRADLAPETVVLDGVTFRREE